MRDGSPERKIVSGLTIWDSGPGEHLYPPRSRMLITPSMLIHGGGSSRSCSAVVVIGLSDKGITPGVLLSAPTSFPGQSEA